MTTPLYLVVGGSLMSSETKYINLSEREIDLLLLRFLTIYSNYDLAESILLIVLTTEMGEA